MNEALLAIIKATIVDPALQATLIAKLTETKFAIRTPQEEEQYRSNLLSSEKENILREEKKAWMKRVEDDVREATGLKQNPSEPFHDFMKRGYKTIQEKLAQVEQEKVLLEQSKGKDGDTAIWRTKYETLEKQSVEALAAKDKMLGDLQKSVSIQERQVKLNEVFNPLQSKFIDQLPGFFNDYKEQILKDTLNKSQLIDGKLVLVDENGNPRKDSNLNNITVESFLSEKFKDVIKTEKTQGGSGSQPPPGASGKPDAPSPFSVAGIPADVNSQSLLIDHLGKKGLLQGTKEFDEAFSKAVTEKNITKVF